MNAKSQAALEFLTTYGWAIVVIMTMVAALAYFGVLNPSKILPNRCAFGTEFQCVDYQISATANTFRLRLKNNVGEPISISAMTLGSDGQTQYSCPGPPANTPAIPYTFATGSPVDFLFNNCNSQLSGFVAGEKGKVSITITYNSVASGSTYSKQAKGEVYSIAQ